MPRGHTGAADGAGVGAAWSIFWAPGVVCRQAWLWLGTLGSAAGRTPMGLGRRGLERPGPSENTGHPGTAGPPGYSEPSGASTGPGAGTDTGTGAITGLGAGTGPGSGAAAGTGVQAPASRGKARAGPPCFLGSLRSLVCLARRFLNHTWGERGQGGSVRGETLAAGVRLLR